MKLTNSHIRKIIKEELDAIQFDQQNKYESSDMVKSNLYSISQKAMQLHDLLENGESLPEWIKEKIAICDEYIDVINDYIQYEEVDV